MILRNRSTGGIPLTKENAFFFTFIGIVVILLLQQFFWFPLFGVPEELEKYLVFLGVGLYLHQCAGRIPQGKERALLFFGMYTGVSFPAGIYFLPKIPFPGFSLFIFLFFKEEVWEYLGWTLEGDVSVRSIIVPVESGGLTRDGVRVGVTGTLILEIENAAIYLAQLGDDNNEENIVQAVQDQYAFHVKHQVISRYTAKQMMQGEYSEDICDWVTYVCSFVEEYGLRLTNNPVKDIIILDEQVRKIFDLYNARTLFAEQTKVVGLSFAEFRKLNPDLSEEMAITLFSQSRGVHAENPSINVIKIR